MKRVKRRPVPRPPASVRRRGWHPAIILLAGLLTYSNSLSGPFVFDDRGTVLDNPTIERFWDPAVLAAPQETPAAGRPIVNISFALNYALGGRAVRGYHIVNIAIHLVCALLVFAVVRRTLQNLSPARPAGGDRRSATGEPWLREASNIAFAVALIWTVHPLNSEVVSYLSQRTESLMALFYLLTMYAGVRAMEEPGRHGWSRLAVLSCALGMACKESMATAPLMVLVYDRVFVSGSFAHALRTRWRLYAGLAATWLVLALLMTAAPRTLSAGFTAHDAAPWTYLLNQAAIVTRYLWLAIWPRALAIYYGWPLSLTLADVWPQALVVLSLLALTIAALIRSPRLGFLGVWFFVTLAPTSSIVPIATEVGAERRMYLPLIAVVALGVLAAPRVRSVVRGAHPALLSARAAKLAGTGALLAVSALLSARTVDRNRDYQSSLRLAETTLERWPTPAARSMLGTELAAAGRLAEAETQLRAAAPDFPPARYYLATVLARQGDDSEAIALFQDFIRLQPAGLDQVHLARGLMADLFMKNQRWTEAITEYEAMLSSRPADRDARRLLATALVRQQSYEGAIQQYRLLLTDHPDDVVALGGMGVALASVGRMDGAIAAFRRVVELDPGNSHARQNLARALEMK